MDENNPEVQSEGNYIPGVVTAAEVDDLQGTLNTIRTPGSISFEATVEDYQEVSKKNWHLCCFPTNRHTGDTGNPAPCSQFARKTEDCSAQDRIAVCRSAVWW